MRSILFLLCCAMLSCSHEQKIAPPADLIPEEQMVRIMAEVHLLEATLDDRSTGPVNPQHMPGLPMNIDPSVSKAPPAKNDTLGYYNVFSQFKVTRKQYEASAQWYCTQPDRLHRMYEKVVSELTKREAQDQAGGK